MWCAARPRTSTAAGAIERRGPRSAPRTSTTSVRAGRTFEHGRGRLQARAKTVSRPRLGLRRRSRRCRSRYFRRLQCTPSRRSPRTATSAEIEPDAGDQTSQTTLMETYLLCTKASAVELGGVFRDFQYSIGQFNRGADPTTDGARGARSARHVGLRVRREELHGDARPGNTRKPDDNVVRLERHGLRQSHRERPDQDRTTPASTTVGASAAAAPATTSPAASATGAAICSIRSASTSTTRRASMSATGATR